MRRVFFRKILQFFGWRAVPEPGRFPDQFVLIVAPHTSMWDFVWGYCCMQSLGVRMRILIKQEMFFFPLGALLKWLGAIPVDRSPGNNTVSQVVSLIRQHSKIVVVITPEGTRKPTARWKKGFYRIAMEAKIPLGLGYLDYATKTYGIPEMLMPTGNYSNDLLRMRSLYQGKKGKHPDRFVLPTWPDPKR
jgi:1-acyl-sn-glycerol-3-phosphate acyltransferase